jgi:hypothetical protein
MLSLRKTCQGFRPVILCLSFMCAVSLLFLSSQSYAAEAVGKFTRVEGKVDILRQGALPAMPAHVDDSLFQKDIIRTKSSSGAEIRFKDNTVLRIAQRSRIDISEYFSGESNKGIIKLSRGQVQAVVDKSVTKRISLAPGANRFEIQTPNAVAGVRGTTFHVLYDKDVTTVLLKDGDVCVFNIKSEANVVCMPPGYIVTVSGDRVPNPPRKATDTEIRIFEKEILPDRAEIQGLENIISVPEGVTSRKQPVRDEIAAVLLKETPRSIVDIPILLPITDFIPLEPSTSDSFSVTGDGAFNSSESSISASGTYNAMNINGNADEGIAQMVLGGAYTATQNDSWSLSVTGSDGEGYTFDADIAGTQWSSNRINASASGYWIDARRAAPSTGIYIGETIGTFNPSDLTWQAITTGTWMETNRFLQMAADPAGRDKLQQLNIPAFEVGRTNLTGSLVAGTGNSLDYVSVLMNNVAFFAPSNGQKPGVWATNTISGQYNFSHSILTPGNITGADNVIAISNGDGISADFRFTQWNTTNNTWSSGIRNGTGTLSGGSYNGPVSFRGGAAGTLTGTGSGSFSGTGAGVVK